MNSACKNPKKSLTNPSLSSKPGDKGMIFLFAHFFVGANITAGLDDAWDRTVSNPDDFS